MCIEGRVLLVLFLGGLIYLVKLLYRFLCGFDNLADPCKFSLGRHMSSEVMVSLQTLEFSLIFLCGFSMSPFVERVETHSSLLEDFRFFGSSSPLLRPSLEDHSGHCWPFWFSKSVTCQMGSLLTDIKTHDSPKWLQIQVMGSWKKVSVPSSVAPLLVLLLLHPFPPTTSRYIVSLYGPKLAPSS